MNRAEIDALVECFLIEREREPDLTPSRFTERAANGSSEVLAAIEHALGLETLFAAARMDVPAFPRAIGPYSVVGVLGRGGMGIVYDVERDGRRFALKLLPHAAVLGPAAIERFRREARALARIECPSIVAIHDSGSSDGGPWLVMDKVDGELLANAAKPFDPQRAARVVRDLARAVQRIHEAGIVHRDIKPQNVILRPDDMPVLIDFGLVESDGESTLTASAAVLGTPRYMAPEQARGEPADVRSDVYALGLILYELCCGVPVRAEASREALIAHAARGRVTDPRRHRVRLPRELAAILFAALAWNPARRPVSAAELADDLDRFVRGEPVRCSRPAWWSLCMDEIRRSPARSAGTLAVVAVAVLVVALLPRGPSAAARAAGRVHLDAALCALAGGDRAWALLEIDRALREVPGEPFVAQLEQALRSDSTGALERELAGTAANVPWLDALRARELRASGRADDALRLLRGGAARERDWAASHAEEAETLATQGDLAGAAGVWEHALRLQPTCGPLRASRARVLLRHGDVDGGVEDALSALDLYRAAGRDFESELPRLIATATDADAACSALELRLPSRAADATAWFVLGYLRDAQHRLSDARRAYERALAIDPRHLRSLLNVAHLYAGAQLGACAQCDEAYAREPDLPNGDEALAALLRAVDADGGRTEFAFGRIVQTALDLKQRFERPQAAIDVATALERCMESAPAGAQPRLAEAAQRLRDAVGAQ